MGENMKRILSIIGILSLVCLPLLAGISGLSIISQNNASAELLFVSGSYSLEMENDGDSSLSHYDFDNANDAIRLGNKSYASVRIPIFYDQVLPRISATVLKDSTGVEHANSGQFYQVSDTKIYRHRSFVYLILNPFYNKNHFAQEIKINIEGVDPLSFTSSVFSAENDIKNYLTETVSKKSADSPYFSPAGLWLTASADSTGIFEISRQDLSDAGVTLDFTDHTLSLFDAPNYAYPLRDNLTVKEDFHLRELPLLFMQGADPSEDKWIFYARGINSWRHGEELLSPIKGDYVLNPYESIHTLKIFIGERNTDPKRMSTFQTALTGSETAQEFSYRRLHMEEELINPGNGGELWLGSRLTSQNYIDPALINLSEASSVYADFSFGVASPGAHTIDIYLQDSLFLNIYKNLYNNPDYYSSESDLVISHELEIPAEELASDSRISVQYQGEYSTGEAFYNYVDIIYPSQLIYSGKDRSLWFLPKAFSRSISLSGLQGLSYIFNVSDPDDVVYSSTGETELEMRIAEADSTQQFMIMPESAFKKPNTLVLDDDFIPINSEDMLEQNDMVIIAPEAFLAQAERLAEHKENRSRYSLKTLVKTYEEITEQYNAGNRDPYAIRYFLHDLYMHAPDPKPAYVLLLGDGHYDYKNKLYSKAVYIPYLYEEGKQWNCDDIFVNLDGPDDRINDMAIGRIPAESLSEATASVDKIIDYEENTYYGDWQIKAMLVADDPTDEAQNRYGDRSFIVDSEKLWQSYIPPVMRSSKVYLTEYPERYITELQTMGRDGAREDIMESFNTGVALVNYYGHGDPSVWTQENVFASNDLLKMDVKHHYPIVTAATCSWGRSDSPDLQSMAEKMVTLAENGGIASIATVRSVQHSPNRYFIQSFYSGLFPDYPEVSPALLGDAYLYAKNLSNSSSNYRKNNKKFMLFGDPTLIPAFPEQWGSFTQISRDTLRALDRVELDGIIFTKDSLPLSGGDLSGTLSISDNCYQVSREYVNNSRGQLSTIEYYLEGNKLFNGSISIQDAAFSAQAFIPKDIQYMGKNAKIQVLYKQENSSLSGALLLDTIHVGGVNPDAAADNQGPMISLKTDQDLMNGSVVRDTSIVRIEFQDASGINITNQTGHSLELSIDDGSQTVDLTELFYYDENSYTLGYVDMTFGDYLDAGDHNLSIRAFDNYNNYSQKEISLTVLSESEAILNNVVNFPNPFSGSTEFTFISALEGSAEIHIYSLSGRPVDSIDMTVSNGFNHVYWQAEDMYGSTLAAGVYLYVVKLETVTGDESYNGKLLILP